MPVQSARWQTVLADAERDPARLLRRLGLADDPVRGRIDAAPDFAVRVPEPFLARMRPGDPDDPLLRQVLALDAERVSPAGFVADPLAEADASPLPGLLHKYAGRALLVLTGACAVNCRYCFRREFPYAEHRVRVADDDPRLAWLAANPSVGEVILSGGDPLLVDDAGLAALLDRLEAIPSLRRLRIHTRLPIVIPQRVTPALTERLARSRLRVAVVLHANHARELGDDVDAALEPLRAARLRLLNQAVLLAGVNDDVPALAALSERLDDLGVVPYYLHLLDRVRGAAHFEVEERRARALHADLGARLPGWLVPRLAREVPGAPGKVWEGPDYALRSSTSESDQPST